jgi:hypothetical protein
LPVTGLGSLAEALDATSGDARAFVIRGEILPGTDPRRCRRLLHEHEDGSAPTFRAVACRWLILDYDTIPWPPPREFLWDWQDGALSGVYLRSLLPGEFHRVSFWWQFSSGAGFKPGLRMKLAFWLARAPVDHAVFRPVQPIYIARPIMRGVEDPVPERSGIEWDADDQVEVPELLPEQRKPGCDAISAAGDRWCEMPATGHGWQYGVLQEVAEAIARTPPSGRNRWDGGGRHHALFCGALRVSGLIDEGFLDPAGAVQVLATAAAQAGLAEAEAARTIRNAFRRGGLPA